MRADVLQENLAWALSVAGRAVSDRGSLPVLGNFRLKTSGGRLWVTATNLELALTAGVGARVEIGGDGEYTVPAKAFADLVGTLPQDRISLTAEANKLSIQCGRVKASLKGIPADEFPRVPTLDHDKALALDFEILSRLVREVAFSAATDEARPVLQAIKFIQDKGVLTLETADGFRLSRASAAVASDVALSALIPARALSELLRAARKTDQDAAYLQLQDNYVLFSIGSVELVAQRMEGNFPDLSAVIPKKDSTTCEVDAGQLRVACAQAEVFAREAAHTGVLKISKQSGDEPDLLTVCATSAETGDNEAVLETKVNGKGLDVALNVRYLMQMLDAVGAETVVLGCTTPTSPVTVRVVGREADYLHVCMPMHLGK